MKTLKILVTIALVTSTLLLSAQSYHRLTRGGIVGTDLALMLISEGFDDYIIHAQQNLPKITAKMPVRPTVDINVDYEPWRQYSIEMKIYGELYNAQLRERTDFLNQVAYDLENVWLFQNESRMKVCPDVKGRTKWCWTPNDWHYRQWANILMQVWRKLPSYPSNFVSFHMNDHRLQLKDR